MIKSIRLIYLKKNVTSLEIPFFLHLNMQLSNDECFENLPGLSGLTIRSPARGTQVRFLPACAQFSLIFRPVDEISKYTV